MVKELIILKEDLPPLDLSFNNQNEDTPFYNPSNSRLLKQWRSMDSNGWVNFGPPHGGNDNNVFVYQEEIDVSGWGVKGLTFYPTGFNVQNGMNFTGFAADSFIVESVVITQSPFDVEHWWTSLVAVGLQFGQQFPSIPIKRAPTAKLESPILEYDDFLGGYTRMLAPSTNLPLNLSVTVNQTDFSSLEPTATDRLYVTRIVQFQRDPQFDYASLRIPAARVLLSGVTSADSKLAYLLRLKNSFKLSQSDVGLI